MWLPGDAAQCDLWFSPKKIPFEDGSKTLLPVMVIIAAHSWFMVGRMIPTRHTQDLLLAMWMLLQLLDRVPRRRIRDNESGIGRGKRHAEGSSAFTGTLATTLQRLKPNDPESKGVVERRNGFFETSFMPGRDFSSPADFDAQFTDWLAKANNRVVRTIKARPESARCESGGDAATAAGRTTGRMGQPGPVGTRLIRPHRLQQLLRRSCCDRPVRRRHRPPVPG